MILMKMIIGTIKTSSMKKTSRTSTRDNSKSEFRSTKEGVADESHDKMHVVSFSTNTKFDDRFNKVYDDGDEGVDEDDDVS